MHISFMGISHSCNMNFKKNIYAQSDFVTNTRATEEIQIIENIADAFQQNGSTINKNDVFYSVGRIFEKAGAFDVAKTFYEKLKSSPNLSRKETADLEFDIKRINDKNAQESAKYWEV